MALQGMTLEFWKDGWWIIYKRFVVEEEEEEEEEEEKDGSEWFWILRNKIQLFFIVERDVLGWSWILGWPKPGSYGFYS